MNRGNTRHGAAALAMLAMSAAAGLGGTVPGTPASPPVSAASEASSGPAQQQGDRKAPADRSKVAGGVGALRTVMGLGFKPRRPSYIKRPHMSQRQRLRLEGKYASNRKGARRGR
jgi:hypothetical protein